LGERGKGGITGGVYDNKTTQDKRKGGEGVVWGE